MDSNVLYIGVSGLLAKDAAVIAVLYESITHRWKSNKKKPLLFLGLQTSRRFLNGEPVDLSYYSRMNTIDDITFACESIAGIESSKILVHYEPDGSYNQPEIEQHVKFLLCENIGGIEWNGFESFRKPMLTPRFPERLSQKINSGFISVLQIGEEDFRDPHEFSERMNNPTFEQNHTHLILNGRDGRGSPINEEKVIAWIKTLRQYGNVKGITLSKNIEIDALDKIENIKKELEGVVEISIDAGGKLQNNVGFSVDKAMQFIKKAIKLYQ